ncbi:MAG: hypothetical protein FH749_07805 [Firmicutes bacterium]|nr:hypothetical protein [Bacillota bacterium]
MAKAEPKPKPDEANQESRWVDPYEAIDVFRKRLGALCYEFKDVDPAVQAEVLMHTGLRLQDSARQVSEDRKHARALSQLQAQKKEQPDQDKPKSNGKPDSRRQVPIEPNSHEIEKKQDQPDQDKPIPEEPKPRRQVPVKPKPDGNLKANAKDGQNKDKGEDNSGKGND